MPENLRAVQQRVGKNIVDLRRSRRWTQEQLAEKIGKDLKHLGQIERGKVNVTIEFLTAIAAALEVNVGDLFVSRTGETATSRVYVVPQRLLDQNERTWQALTSVTRRQRRRRGVRR
jgi:transcriptional regulator with XRE-family HTH domain